MKKALVALTIVVVAVIGFNVMSHAFAEDETFSYTPPVVPDLQYYEGPPDPQEMLELVNRERAKVGVAPLTIDENVQASAQIKAEDMDTRNYFAHNLPGKNYTQTPEMEKLTGQSCSSSSENITDNGKEFNFSSQSVTSWVNSKPHYEAMINAKYSKTGFGVSDTIVVQHLCVVL